MRKSGTSCLLVVLLIGAQVLGVAAQGKQKQDQSEIKLRTELVQIDVLVTDKNNRPVAGLKREDFQLYDNNKLQNIASFAYEETRARRVEENPAEAHSLPRAIGASELKRVIAFVVDTLHIKFENTYRTRKMLEDFVDNKMLSTSSLFLSGQEIQDGKVVSTAGEGGTPSQRRFKSGSEFSYAIIIYNAKLDGKTKQPELEMRTRVLKGSKVIFNSGVRPVEPAQGSSPPSRIIASGILRLRNLASDDYTLEVTVHDKMRGKGSQAVIRQEMDFSVE